MDLKPSDIYYSQDSVSNVFGKGCHSDQLIGLTLDELCEGRISTCSIPKIEVVQRSGKWVSYDNRRLWVFRQMERLGKCSTIKVTIKHYIRMSKFSSKNGGESVKIRGKNPGGSWYLKDDASISRSTTHTQSDITQQDGLGSMTQNSESLENSYNRSPTSYPVFVENVTPSRTLSGQMNSLRFQPSSGFSAQQTTATSQCDTSVLDPKILVAAIDFGTTNSGYAFSCRSDFENDPMKIVTNQWKTSDGRSVTFKAPTCVLFDEAQRFDSFGFKAEETYSKLVIMNQHSNWYLFKHFKMELYENKDLNIDTAIKDTNGKRMMAITVVSECIKYLMTSLLETCNQATQIILPTDIHWVITVPAIWNDGAKQFMRKAAIQAGILSDSLTLALEPEAASMFCKHVKVEDDSDEEDQASAMATASKYALCPGSKYVILDAGGGTVDITVHEIKWNGKIKEIHKANGGPWGGTNVDEAFVRFLENVFGKRVMADFQSHNNGDYLDMMREFELKKKTVDPQLHEDIKLKMPSSLYESYKRVNDTEFSVSDVMKKLCQMKIVRDKLVISSQKVVEMFRPTCIKIVTHLQDLFIQPAMNRINTVVMVGGFSESRCLQRDIGQAFPTKSIVIPKDPGLAVVKGAVINGHAPKAIVSRIARYTYGVATTSSFIEGVSKESKRFIFNGEDLCRDILDIHVRVGEVVTVDEYLMEQLYTPLYDRVPFLSLPIYSSQNRNPTYTDELGCSFIGKINVRFDDPCAERETKTIEVRFSYGNTELGVEAKIVKTNTIVKASFDFLG